MIVVNWGLSLESLEAGALAQATIPGHLTGEYHLPARASRRLTKIGRPVDFSIDWISLIKLVCIIFKKGLQMKIGLKLALVTAALGLTAPAYAGTINLATGLDGSNNLQTAGDSLDAHWQITNGNNQAASPNGYVTTPSNADWYPFWLANGPNSAWIAGNPDNPNNGAMIFTRTFTITNPSSSSITGAWAIDDAGTLSLNGNLLSSLGTGAWGGLTAFSAPSSDFVVGVNTLVMQITYNDGYLEAGRLEGTLTTDLAGAVPEPSTWAMMIIGFAGLAYAGYRRQRKFALGMA